MQDEKSILDKIILTKHQQEAAQFDPTETISSVMRQLSAKERDILHRRVGLLGKKKETLEQIGKNYQITRERIRQIEGSVIEKIKSFDDFSSRIAVAEHRAGHVLESHGGLMEAEHMLEELLSFTENNDVNRQSCVFLLDFLLTDKIESIDDDTILREGWRLRTAPVDPVKKMLEEIIRTLETNQLLLDQPALVEAITAHEQAELSHPVIELRKRQGLTEEEEQLVERMVLAILRLSKTIGRNILGQWGMSDWNTVAPKRMADKVYLVLKKVEKPLHFTDITKLVNESSFDLKVAYPATVHNELILDKRFVLVGRGIYALEEWGYAPGTVIDIITTILRKFPEGLTRDSIVDEVLKQRIVRKSTIYLALSNKDRVRKGDDQRYLLASV